MAKLVHTVAVFSLFVACCSAQTPAVKVLPWNGHSAAVSLTFDDARTVHLDVAIPELNKRHLHATFFLIVSKLTRLDDWRRAQSQGHEIGNHSVSHLHSADLNKETEETQVEDAKNFLDSNFKSNVVIFAYPYTEISPGLAFWVKRYDFAARGGRDNSNELFIRSDVQPDWYNLPSQASCSKCDTTVYKGWIDQATSMHAWTILQIHGIGDPSTGFEPIPTNTFIYLLDYLKAQEGQGLWGRAIRRSCRVLAGPEDSGSSTAPGCEPRGTICVDGSHSFRARSGAQGHRERRQAYAVVSGRA